MAETQPLFSVEGMLAAASAATGLDDFGDDEFREALTRLVDSTNRESTLSAIGTVAFPADVQRILVNRLRFAADLKKHPEILDEDVSDPIVVIGLPRTGTTKLQRMMAADPDVQRLEYWRVLNPAPFPETIPGQADPRIAAAEQAIAMMAQLMPGWSELHPTAAEAVDEEEFLKLFTFKCIFTQLARPLPSFKAWYFAQPQQGTYRYMKQLLQYLQWQDGGKQGRPWILKTPGHLGNMDLVLECFPKATVVVTHRDPRKLVPSLCRLAESSWRFFSESVDMQALGQAGLHDFLGEMKKHLRWRDRVGDAANVYDVRYEQIRDDPLGVIGEIYRRAGRELTPQRKQAMLDWAANQTSHREGNYKAEDYGLSDAVIDEAYREYNERFLR